METPKVACTTIKTLLQRWECGERIALPDPHDKRSSPLLSPKDSPRLFLKALYAPYFFRFCFVRNPFSRILSCYVDKLFTKFPPMYAEHLRVQRPSHADDINAVDFLRLLVNDPSRAKEMGPASGLSFLEFLRILGDPEIIASNTHWRPQSELLSVGHIKYDFIGKLERFSEDWEVVCRAIGVKPEPTKRQPHAVGASRLIETFYGNDEIAEVISLYRMDFENFEYQKSLDTLAGVIG